MHLWILFPPLLSLMEVSLLFLQLTEWWSFPAVSGQGCISKEAMEQRISAAKQHPKEHLQQEIAAEVIFEKCSLYHAHLSADNVFLTHSFRCFCVSPFSPLFTAPALLPLSNHSPCPQLATCYLFPVFPYFSQVLLIFSSQMNFPRLFWFPLAPHPVRQSRKLMFSNVTSTTHPTSSKSHAWQASNPAYFTEFQGQ